MAKKTFAVLGFLTLLVLALGVVSAASVTNNNVTLTLNESSFELSDGDYLLVEAEITNENTDVEYFTIGSESFNLASSGSHTVELNLSLPTSGDLKVVLTAYNDSTVSESEFTITGTIENFDTTCEFNFNVSDDPSGNDLEISDFDILNNGNGDDEEWEYMDNIEITVEVGNTDDDDSVSDVEVKIIILDSDGNDVTGDFDFEDEVLDDIKTLKEDSEESVTFVIEELSTDIDDGDYRLYIVAYSDGEEDEQCISTYDDNDFTDDLYYEFSVTEVDYEDAIIVRESKFEDIDAACGQNNLMVSVPVYNLNTDDEEMILVNLYNSELGINEYKTIEDLNDGDKETVDFYVDIPSNLDKDQYELKVYLFYDWDDDEDEMEESSYEEDNDFSTNINIIGCQAVAPSMGVNLESSMKVGEELVVKATVKNNGDSDNFEFDVSGYGSWAELISINPENSILGEGESTEITVTLIPNEAGSHSFVISAVVGEDTFNQPVSVNVEEEDAQLLGLSGVTLFLVAGILGMLVLILGVLVVKVASKKPVRA